MEQPSPSSRSTVRRFLAGAGAVLLGALPPSAGVAAASHVKALPLPFASDQAQITNGILALGIVLVIIVIVGVLLGSRGRARKKPNANNRK
jgi:hypothetical protein